jgi:hypothetical protein
MSFAKKAIVSVALIAVMASPAQAANPRGGRVRSYVQRSAAGWQTAGRSVVAAGRWAASNVHFGDSARIGSRIQGAVNQAQGH